MSNIPDGWVYTFVGGAGSNLAIVVPAGGPAVRHVLDHIDVELFSNGAGAINFGANLTVLDGATVIFTPLILALNAPAATFSAQTYSADGPFMGSSSTAMTVNMTVVLPAGSAGVLTLRGHDI